MLGKNANIIEPSLLLQPDYIQLGREVLEELLQVHPSYKYLLSQIFWATMQQRSKELARMGLTTKKVPLEFYQKVSAGDDLVKVNEGERQWDILNPAKVLKLPAPEGFICPECQKVFKSAQARSQHQTSGKHYKVPCLECNRTFVSPQALADHVRAKHKK